jgi:hypothetical protein
MTILYNFASRSRPAAFFSTLDNIIANSSSPDFFIIAKLDEDDLVMNNNSIKEQIESYSPTVEVRWGSSKSKIHAINRDIPKEGWDIIINISDDQRFIVHGFDKIIRKYIQPDSYLHFPDSFKKEKLCTMYISDRVYFERFGFIYNPAYDSLWADDEADAVAKMLERYKFVDIPIADHLHYSNGKAVKDALYKRNDTYRKDQAVFNQRKAINFGL